MTARSTQEQELVGTKEAAEIFGVRPPNFVRDWSDRPDFPPPVAHLAATRVWRRQDLEAYRHTTTGISWPPRRRDLHLSPAAERWLPTIKRRLVRRFGPDRIVLFGSQARGEARPDSDLDLLVVMGSDLDARETRIAMRRELSDLPLAKDIFLTTPDRVERYGDLVGTILHPALREGVTIYVRE